MFFGLTGVEVRKIVKELLAYHYIGQVIVIVKPYKPFYLLGAAIS
jgi:hypothetical protein